MVFAPASRKGALNVVPERAGKFRLWFSLLFTVISGLSIPFLPAASPVQDTIDVAMYFDHGEGQEISGLPNEQFPIGG